MFPLVDSFDVLKFHSENTEKSTKKYRIVFNLFEFDNQVKKIEIVKISVDLILLKLIN